MSTLFILLFVVAVICLPVSLIVPSLFGRITQGSRKRATQVFGSAVLILFVLVGLTLPSATTNKSESSVTETKQNVVETVENSDVKKVTAPTIALITPTNTPVPTSTPLPTKVTAKPTPFPTAKKLLLQPTATPIPTVYIPATSAPVQQPAAGGFSCSCSKTCSQMVSCAEAQYQLNVCGCGARDADNDGIACDADCQ